MISGQLTLAPTEWCLSTHPMRSDPFRSTAPQCSLQSCHRPHLPPHRHLRPQRSFRIRLDIRMVPWSKSRVGYTESMLQMSHRGSRRLLLYHHMDRMVIMLSVHRILQTEFKVVNLGSACLGVTRRITSSGPMDRTRLPLLLRLRLRTVVPSLMATMHHHHHLLSPRLHKTTTTRRRTWIDRLDMTSTSIADGRMVSLHQRPPRRRCLMEGLPMAPRTQLLHLGLILVRSHQISSLHRGIRTMPTAFFPNLRLSLHTSNSARIQAIMAAVITTTSNNNTIIIRLHMAMESRLPWLESMR